MPLDVAKVFVCGDYGIGKTTLIETLTSQRHLKPDEQPPDEPDKPDERTAGIEVRHLTMGDDGSTAATPLASVSATSSQATAGPVASDSDSDDDSPTKRSKLSFSTFTCVRMAVFDFGGQPEFHVIHTLLVSDWTAAFVVCVDLSKSHEELKQSLWYWLRFIATRVKQSRETLFASELQDYDAIDKRPRVILVGTKVDKCHASHRLNTNDGSSQRLTSCVHTAGSTFGSVLNIVTSGSLIALNCFRGKDNGFEMLKGRLAQHWMAIKRRALVVPRIVSEVSTMLEAIRNETTLSTSIDEVLLKMRAMHAGFLAMGDTLSPDLFRATLR